MGDHSREGAAGLVAVAEAAGAAPHDAVDLLAVLALGAQDPDVDRLLAEPLGGPGAYGGHLLVVHKRLPLLDWHGNAERLETRRHLVREKGPHLEVEIPAIRQRRVLLLEEVAAPPHDARVSPRHEVRPHPLRAEAIHLCVLGVRVLRPHACLPDAAEAKGIVAALLVVHVRLQACCEGGAGAAAPHEPGVEAGALALRLVLLPQELHCT
mmetsp:Transcript_33955/g.97640  ORF Transcript_33955/g.97640 Transcript_33955/m.97640 type:complete len:210 (+) Transcript_33955:340-969(+)